MRYSVIILLIVLIVILGFKFLDVESVTGNLVNDAVVTLTKVSIISDQIEKYPFSNQKYTIHRSF